MRARGQGRAREGVPRDPWGPPGSSLGPPTPSWVPLFFLWGRLKLFPFSKPVFIFFPDRKSQEQPGECPPTCLWSGTGKKSFCLFVRNSRLIHHTSARTGGPRGHQGAREDQVAQETLSGVASLRYCILLFRLPLPQHHYFDCLYFDFAVKTTQTCSAQETLQDRLNM